MTELDWIKEAKKFLGHREIGATNKSPIIDGWAKELGATWVIGQPWCGTYIAHCLKHAGIKYPKHWYRALDYLNYGAKLKKPAYGCVAVKTRNGGGHVCFVVGKTPQGKLVVIGGNQGNKVCYTTYSQSEFDGGFIWYGNTPNPAPERYNLPIIKTITSSKLTEA